jgi:hypothetical protein
VTIKISDKEFIASWKLYAGSPTDIAKALGMSYRGVLGRRTALENRLGIHLPTETQVGNAGRGDAEGPNDYLQRHTIGGFTGTAVVFSDAHYWPGQEPSIAHKGLVEVVKALKPGLIIGNGDLFDGARLSRFPRNGWEYQPRVKDELEEALERLGEVRHAWTRAQAIRTIGNHCIRFDRYLATHASEMEQVMGARLSDHLPAWKECLSVFINGHTMVKHRFNGGIHAAYNNTLKAGTNIITGHTHHLEVKPWADYRGRRYGVQTGAIAAVDAPQFSYTEDNPTPWCSGFAVLTFDKDGRLLHPELAEVIEGACYFRGQIVAGSRRKRAA